MSGTTHSGDTDDSNWEPALFIEYVVPMQILVACFFVVYWTLLLDWHGVVDIALLTWQELVDIVILSFGYSAINFYCCHVAMISITVLKHKILG
ncbi:hypothetical protein [Haloarcula rara]|uniref:hypothetical protein n=1 Tax=Haloarcula rara TaxID=3033387 RepID=UPI0023E8A41A|nr:hypothetical protein [Halomicroarcula sp. SHR3]